MLPVLILAQQNEAGLADDRTGFAGHLQLGAQCGGLTSGIGAQPVQRLSSDRYPVHAMIEARQETETLGER